MNKIKHLDDHSKNYLEKHQDKTQIELQQLHRWKGVQQGYSGQYGGSTLDITE